MNDSITSIIFLHNDSNSKNNVKKIYIVIRLPRTYQATTLKKGKSK